MRLTVTNRQILPDPLVIVVRIEPYERGAILLSPTGETTTLKHEYVVREFLQADLSSATDICEVIGVVGMPQFDASIALTAAASSPEGFAEELCDVQLAARYLVTNDESVFAGWDRVDDDLIMDDQSWLKGNLTRGERCFAAVVNTYLKRYSPAIVLLDSQSAEPVPAVTALCVQLYNVLVDGSETKICANEACEMPFQRQRVGYGSGTRRHGVKYCSPECANAQNQRRHRRRRR